MKQTFSQHIKSNWMAYVLSLMVAAGPVVLTWAHSWVNENEKAINAATDHEHKLQQQVNDLQHQVDRECHP